MNINISTRTVFSLLLIVFSLWVSFQIQEIIISLFVALLISLALVPLIKNLEVRKLSRPLATTLVYAVFLLLTVLLLAYGLSPLVDQTSSFISQLPSLLDTVLTHPLIASSSRQIIENVSGQLSSASGGILQLTLNIFSSFFTLITILVFSFYLSLEFEPIKKRFLSVIPDEGNRKKFDKVLDEAELKIGSWVRGELILGLAIGILTYVGLTILRVNYAVPLAVIAGILEIVPLIGPIISAVPAAVVGFAASPVLGLGVVALFILIQQVENTFVVPKVMQKVVDIDPILTLLVILIGGKLFGILGALLSVPVTLVVFIILKNFYYKNA